MRALYLPLLVTAIFWSLSASPISHIGGGIRSSISGYSANAPIGLQLLGAIGDEEALHYEGGRYFDRSAKSTSGPIQREELLIYEPAAYFPEFELMNQEAIESYLVNAGWTQVASSSRCGIAYHGTRYGLYHRIELWGSSRGIMLIGTDRPFIKVAVQRFLKSVNLHRRACQWK